MIDTLKRLIKKGLISCPSTWTWSSACRAAWPARANLLFLVESLPEGAVGLSPASAAQLALGAMPWPWAGTCGSASKTTSSTARANSVRVRRHWSPGSPASPPRWIGRWPRGRGPGNPAPLSGHPRLLPFSVWRREFLRLTVLVGSDALCATMAPYELPQMAWGCAFGAGYGGGILIDGALGEFSWRKVSMVFPRREVVITVSVAGVGTAGVSTRGGFAEAYGRPREGRSVMQRFSIALAACTLLATLAGCGTAPVTAPNSQGFNTKQCGAGIYGGIGAYGGGCGGTVQTAVAQEPCVVPTVVNREVPIPVPVQSVAEVQTSVPVTQMVPVTTNVACTQQVPVCTASRKRRPAQKSSTCRRPGRLNTRNTAAVGSGRIPVATVATAGTVAWATEAWATVASEAAAVINTIHRRVQPNSHEATGPGFGRGPFWHSEWACGTCRPMRPLLRFPSSANRQAIGLAP